MFLDERIKCYEEILEQDPSSKLFFPLAKLYFEKQDFEKSISVLSAGLEKHPDHFEARLFLIELLTKSHQKDKAISHIRKVEELLISYPSFWRNWAEILAERGNTDLAGFITLIGLHFDSNQRETVGETLYYCLNEHKVELLPAKKDATEIEGIITGGTDQEADDIEFKTKTMADILMSQADYKGALEIYEELLKKETNDKRREILKNCIKKAKEKMKFGNILSSDNARKKELVKKKKLLSRLRLLVKRFEARAC